MTRHPDYDRVAMEFDGSEHQLVERVDGRYRPVDE